MRRLPGAAGEERLNLRFTRIIGGGPKRPRKKGRSEVGRGFVRTGDDDVTAARPAAQADSKHLNPASYLVISAMVSTFLFGFFLLYDRGFLQARRERQQLGSLQAEVSKLAKDNQRLEEEITALQTDPKAVEKIAREELRLVKPGDVVIVLPPGWKSRVK